MKQSYAMTQPVPSLPEIFQNPVAPMAMERVIRRQGGMIEILGGVVEHPKPPHKSL